MNLIPTHGIIKKSTRAERIYMEFLDYSEMEPGEPSISFHRTNIGVCVGNLFMLVAEHWPNQVKGEKGEKNKKGRKREREKEKGKKRKKEKKIIMSIIIICLIIINLKFLIYI